MPLADVIPALARAPIKYLREIAPGVHVFGSVQPMSRVRSYQTNVLNPIGGRGNPTETVLVGHLHTDTAGNVVKVEGFLGAGQEGKAWAEGAYKILEGAGLLAAGATLNAETPMRGCPHAR